MDREINGIELEDMQKYIADAAYEAAVSLHNLGKDKPALGCLFTAYSLYKKMEDVEGIMNCRSLVRFDNRLESKAFDVGKGIYASLFEGRETSVPSAFNPRDFVANLKEDFMNLFNSLAL